MKVEKIIKLSVCILSRNPPFFTRWFHYMKLNQKWFFFFVFCFPPDQVPPEVECPNDYTDVSSADNVEVASLPLPPIIKSDNIGLREENPVEFSPTTVDSDGRERRVTVSIYDIAGNKAECQFTLTLNKQGKYHHEGECFTIYSSLSVRLAWGGGNKGA